jgi:hypothetical protein
MERIGSPGLAAFSGAARHNENLGKSGRRSEPIGWGTS